MKRFYILIFVLFHFNAHSQTLQTVNSVHTLSYELENGNIYIYLPEKIVANKPFSGTVAIYPKGNSTREQSKNLEKLKKIKIAALGKEFLAGIKTLSLTSTASEADISLKTPAGKVISSTRVQLDLKPQLSPDTPLTLPGHIANSVNTSFYGVFDGNITNTTVKANGKALEVVAESPVQIALRPENLTSTSSTIEISDGASNYQGQCNSIYYTLKVGPTNLKRGQSTYFDATIHGVGTIQEPLSYTVVNDTPNIVRLDGGNAQSFVINPGDGEAGNWFHHFNIQSLTTGNFGLTTTLVVPDTPYPGNNSTPNGVISDEASVPTQENIDCRILNQSFNINSQACSQLGGAIFDGSYETMVNESEEYFETSSVSVNSIQDSNEIQFELNIEGGDIPEMVVSTNVPLDPEVEAAVQFLTTSEENYSFHQTNQTFGQPSAATIETVLLFSDGSSQTINTQVNFDGNPFYSIAQSPELTQIRSEQNRIKNELRTSQGNKERLQTERNTIRDRYIKARDKYKINHSQFWYLWHIDQSLEKARPVFADSLNILIDSLNTFNKRTGGARSIADTKIIDDNVRDAKKAHQDCLAQLRRLHQEQTDLTNEKETLKEQQKQIHRDIMNQFRSTGMNYAGSTRRDKNGKFHYQYGVVTVSGEGWATYHKGSLPAQILSKVSALEKQMKLVTDRLNAITDRLNNLPAELNGKNIECDNLAQKVKDAETAKKNNDAITAKSQMWNNKIDALCVQIQKLLVRLRIWAEVNDTNLLRQIDNLKCGDKLITQIDGVIKRKKELEAGYEGKTANSGREMNSAKAMLTESDAKIAAAEERIRKAQIALVENQKSEAKAAAVALAKDQDKCLKIMKELGYDATTISDVIDLYEISQDLKKAADEAQDAMNNLIKAVEFGEKQGMDSGAAKKWVKKTQERLSNISKKLAKLEKYRDLAGTIQNYVNQINTMISSDGSPTQNAEAFGTGLNLMNEALEVLANRVPILKVFTAYFTFMTQAYSAIIAGANKAVREQYEQLLKDVRKSLDCRKLMYVCRDNDDELARIKQYVYDEYVVKPGYDALRRDQTQAKDIISKIVEQRMAECCFQRLQAIRAAK